MRLLALRGSHYRVALLLLFTTGFGSFLVAKKAITCTVDATKEMYDTYTSPKEAKCHLPHAIKRKTPLYKGAFFDIFYRDAICISLTVAATVAAFLITKFYE